jgi:hypothetical protein
MKAQERREKRRQRRTEAMTSGMRHAQSSKPETTVPIRVSFLFYFSSFTYY